MCKVKNNGRTRRGARRIKKEVAKEEDEKRMIPCSRRIRKKDSEKEEDKPWIPCSKRIRKKVAKNKEQKVLIRCSRRIRKKVAAEEEEKCSVPRIDNDVATNILTRIPADLLQKKFRHQCREWFHILSDPQFNDANTTRSKAGIIFTMYFMHDERTRMGFMEFEGLDLHVRELNVVKEFEGFHSQRELNVFNSKEYMKIISSCKGLVLADRPTYHDLFILNPTTNERVAIPLCQHKCLWHELVFVPNTKEYKLVDMFYEKSRGTLAFHIRSIGGGWKEWYHVSDILKNVRVLNTYSDLEASVSYNERLSIDGVVYVNLGSQKKIISFDLSNYMVQVLEVPASGNAVRLIDLNGSLAFLDCLNVSNPVGNFPLDVWILKDLNMGIWEKKCQIDCLPELPGEIDCFRWDDVVGTVENGQILVFARESDVYAYDLKTRCWKRTTIGDAALEYMECCPRVHVNSLVPII